MITPIFATHYSISKSILTIEDETEIKENSPVSVIAICKTHNLSELHLVERSFSGFIKSHELCEKHGIQLKFGYKVVVCSNHLDKSEESQKTESKAIIWMLNTDGYKDLLKIHNEATINGFYYYPRISWRFINDNITPNLGVSIPFYSSFLEKNLLYSYQCLPDFSNFKPVFHVENHDLPFDNLIKSAILDYAKDKYETKETKQIYYYKPEHAKYLCVFRCIANRSSWEKPNLNHFSSSSFSYETN